MQTSAPDLRHISRVNSGSTNGWNVRIMRRNEKHSKFFPVKRHGGVEPALSAAVKYRDQLLRLVPMRLPGLATGRDDGIRLVVQGDYRAWSAQWVGADGKRRTKTFNVKKHGNLRAKQLARDARMKGVAGLQIA